MQGVWTGGFGLVCGAWSTAAEAAGSLRLLLAQGPVIEDASAPSYIVEGLIVGALFVAALFSVCRSSRRT